VAHISPEAVLRAYETLLRAVNYEQQAPSDDEDNGMDPPGRHHPHVQLALLLMGHFQPHSRDKAFTDMVNGFEPVAFPSSLKDIMGWTFAYK
jgi:hypothetical protein